MVSYIRKRGKKGKATEKESIEGETSNLNLKDTIRELTKEALTQERTPEKVPEESPISSTVSQPEKAEQDTTDSYAETITV